MSTPLELSLPSGLVCFSRSGLVFNRRPTFEEWFQLGRYLSAARRHSIRWMADWRLSGRREFGDERVAEAESQLELDFKDLKAAAALEALECRVPSLTDEHHFVVSKAKLASDEDRQQWLERAEREDLSPSELRESIKAGEVVRAAPKDGSFLNADATVAGVVTIEGTTQKFLLWEREVRAKGFPEKWDTTRLAKVLNLLNPVGNMIADLVEELEKRVEATAGGAK